jgi:hypothetical protein
MGHFDGVARTGAGTAIKCRVDAVSSHILLLIYISGPIGRPQLCPRRQRTSFRRFLNSAVYISSYWD